MNVDTDHDPEAPVELFPDEQRVKLDKQLQPFREAYGHMTDRDLLLMVVAWQAAANKHIEGLVEQGRKLMANPMIANMLSMMD